MRTAHPLFFVFLFPSLILVGCKRSNEAQESSLPAPASKSGERPSPPADPPTPQTPAPPAVDPAALLGKLTATNGLEIRESLRTDPTRWKSLAGPFYRRWAALNPQAALASARAEDPNISLVATQMALAGWTTTDPRAARDWYDTNLPNPEHLRLANGMIDQWPVDDLAGLADWSTRFQGQPQATRLFTRLASTWSRTAPDATATWLATLPAGPARNQATDFVFQRWGRLDPGASGDYLVANFDHPNSDAAISAYAKAVVPDDPETAALWAAEVTDSRLREEILKIIPRLRAAQSAAPLPQ